MSVMFGEHIPQTITIPDNIREFVGKHDGSVVEIAINDASSNYGYAHMMYTTVKVKKLTKTCWRCGYDEIWNNGPDLEEDWIKRKCKHRHTYGNRRYDTIFSWIENDNCIPLEDAFDIWLSNQPEKWGGNRKDTKDLKRMYFHESKREMISHWRVLENGMFFCSNCGAESDREQKECPRCHCEMK